MEFHLYTCRHCGFEAYYLEAMLKHQAAQHPKPVQANAGAEPREASASGNLLYDTRKNT